MRMFAYLGVFCTVLCTVLFLPDHSTAVKLERDWETLPLKDLDVGLNLALPGVPFFKILNKIGDSVYIGGNETLLQLTIDEDTGGVNIFNKTLETDEDPTLTVTCKARNPDTFENVCWNFIRIAEMTTSGRLLVCGTNAYSGVCYSCPSDLNSASSCTNVTIESTSSKVNIVPYSPTTNPSAAIYVRDTDEDVLYTTSSLESVLERYAVPDLIDNRNVKFELRSSGVQSKFLNAPMFVGKPVDYTDDVGNSYIFFFFREMALEYDTFEQKQYSRIARVCQNDTVVSGMFSTFIKALLNCSIPDELLPFHYNEIQDVIWNDEKAYAVFTSQTLGPKSSALCRFRMEDIMKLFDEGVFKEQVNTNSEWLPTTIQNPRPGKCDEVHGSDETPLMDKLVPNFNPDALTGGDQDSPPSNFRRSDGPMLYVDGVRFTSMAIDFEDSVYFFGTSKGTVIKHSEGKTVEINKLGTTGPVTGLELLEKNQIKHLVITTENNVVTWALNNECSARSKLECDVVKFPYCKWINGSGCVCPSSNPSCKNATANVLVQPAIDNIDSCDNSVIFLYCEADAGPYFGGVYNLSWVKEGDESFIGNNTHLVEETRLSDKLLELKVMVHNSSKGVYICKAEVEDIPYAKYVEVSGKSCLTKGNLEARCDEYTSLKKHRESINSVSGTCNVDVEDCHSCRLGYSSTIPSN